MAIVSMSKVGATHVSRNGTARQPYLVEYDLDFALALAAKGSALVATDVIEVLYLPAGTVVLGGGAVVKTAANSTTLTMNVGSDLAAAEWTSALDGKVANAQQYLQVARAFPTVNTIDVTLATLTGTLSSGLVRVHAMLLDTTDLPNRSGLALLGS